MDIPTDTKTLIINGVTYFRAGCDPALLELRQQQAIALGQKRIIVADKGWVFVGDCADNADGSVTISNAKNIRRWGTTAGLGELATGPINGKTIVDEYGTVRCVPIVTIAVVCGW